MLRDSLDPRRAEATAVAAAGAIFSVLAVVTASDLNGKATAVHVLGALVGTVTLGALFFLIRYAVLWYWAKPLLGRWRYDTTIWGKGEGGHAVAEFAVTMAGEVVMTALLFEREGDAEAATLQNTSTPTPTAFLRSLSSHYEAGTLFFVYELRFYAAWRSPGEAGRVRTGLLRLDTDAPDTPTVYHGVWESSYPGGDDYHAGYLTLTRSQVARGQS